MIEEALAPGGGVTSEMALHIDRCLGCMACMTVCPEDVPYPDLLSAAHAAIRRDLPAPAGRRLRRGLALSVLAHAGAATGRAIPHFTPAQGAPRGRVGLLLGCSTRSELHRAMLAVLAAEGYEVIAPRALDCCGATELHSGERGRALHRAQQTIAAFSAIGGVDHVITGSGACGAMLKHYGDLLGTPEATAFSALVLDMHELLARPPLRSQLGPLRIRIAYHDACQLRHAQGLANQPRDLLSQIPGVELIDLPRAAGACCGAPGAYRLAHPGAAAALGRRQAQALLDTGAELVVSADHACIAQLERQLRELGRPLAVRHPVEVLARAHDAGRAADGRLTD
jgi:glycolate oxidase iron-sulfur subunit